MGRWKLLLAFAAVAAVSSLVTVVATENSAREAIAEKCRRDGELQVGDVMFSCTGKSYPAIPPFPDKKVDLVPKAGSAP